MTRRLKLGLALVIFLVAVIPAEGGGLARNGLIVYAGVLNENAKPEIYAFRLAGGPRVNISRNLGWDDAPALSPDGRKIVFRRDADWVVAEADGSDQHPLAPGAHLGPPASWAPDSRHVAGSMYIEGLGETVIVVDTETSAVQRLGRGRAPRWSPQGTTMAYIGSDGLYVSLLGATPTRVAVGDVRELWWSPDGARIAYARSSGAVAVVDVSTGTTKELATGAVYMPVRWSADGDRVYFVTSQAGFAFVPSNGGSAQPFGPATKRAAGIEVAPSGAFIALVHDGAVTVAAPSGAIISEPGAGVNPSWSPDGTRLAFARDGSLRVAEAPSWDSRALTDGKSDVVYKFPYLQDPPVWRPDGSAVVEASVAGFIETGLFIKEGAGAHEIHLPSTARNPSDPAWSPDGRSIAFTSYGVTPTVMVGDDRLRHVRVIARKGSEPAWSPDGSEVAYVVDSRPSDSLSPFVGSGIFVVGADGRGRRRITRGKDWSPAWSPDGTTIAFARHHQSSGTTGLYLRRLAGGPVSLVFAADGVGQNGEPGEVVSISWSPTDNRLLAFRLTSFSPEKFYSTDDDETLVIALREKGLARVVSSMPAGTSVTWSPDGRFLLHGGNDDSFLGGYPYEGFLPPMTDNVLRITRPDGRPVGSFTVPQRAAAPSWQPLCTRSGSGRADRIRGGSGADVLCGLGGGDIITGGRGRDRIFGQGGNDRIDARDGVFDVIGCGEGRDTVVADRSDLVGVDCERVSRP